jgi:hypothetical protein
MANSALDAINKRAKQIQEAGGKTTETKKVTKYKISRTDAVKQASKELKGK